MKLLEVAVDKQNWDLAAHVLVFGLIKARKVAASGGTSTHRQGLTRDKIGGGKRRQKKHERESQS